MVTDAASAPVLERPDLRMGIRSALDSGSLLLIADAGFGKTTALQDALSDGTDAAWVRCRDAGGDAGRLLGLVVEAIRGALPGAVDVLAERLAAASEPVDPERAAAALESELARLLVDPLVLVVDDAEALEGSQAALAVVARLIAGEGSPLRLAVAARRPPTLRLARERAAGRVAELGVADLVFSAADCAAYLRLARGREPLPEEVESLVEETEGWPLGVVLAVAAGRGAHGPSRDLVDDYFEEEVLGGLAPEERRAVLAAAMAPDLDVAEAAGIAPAGGLGDRRGLFLSGAGASGGQAFHPLFREFLRRRFEQEVPAPERRAVAARLADALEATGRGPDAVAQRIASQDWDAAADAVAREGGALVRRAPETLEAWLAGLPADRARRPELVLLAGQLAHGRGRLGEAVEHCRTAVAGFDANGAPPYLRFVARFALADAYLAVGDLAGAAALGDALDDPGADGDLTARAVGALAAIALASQGRFDDGRALRDRAFADPAAAAIRGQSPAFEAFWLDLPAGRLDDALVHIDQALAAFERVDPFGRLPYVLLFKFAIHEERGEDHAALALAARGREMARQTGLAGWLGAGTSIRIASLQARLGDVAGGEAELAGVGPEWHARGIWELEATRAAIAAARGDSREARAAAERAAADASDDPRWFDRMRCAAMLAPVLVRAGQPGRAREVVELTLAARPPGFSGARLGAILAWLLHEEGDEAGSVAALAAAWAEAGDQARHVVRREWPRVEGPLWAALEHEAVDAVSAVSAVAEALPGGSALGRFTRHPLPAVRRAALLSAVAAGHPEGVDRLSDFERDADPGVAAAARAAADRLRRDPPPLAFRLFGAFELRRGTWVVGDADWKRRVAEQLVRLLLCRGGEPVTEDELIETFWPDKPAAAGRRSLQVAVSAARGVLDLPDAESSRIVAGERSYRLSLGPGDSVDAHDFERAAEAALGTRGEGRRAALVAAAGLWGGEPLPEERYADWAVPWRERLIDRHAEVLAALIEVLADAGDLAAAADVARRLVDLDPVNEAAHRQLIVAYARAGQRGHALRQYLACRRALVAEVGVEPGEETAALQRRVLAGEAV
jgi:DNA-binding SARP family transcriptional activator/tetratricopeptide (TPR) repeat protein